MMYKNYFKRIFDLCCATCVFLSFWWLFLVLMYLVKRKLGSPVFFTQERPGKNSKLFKLYKFRTMTDERDSNDNLLPDSQRLTKFGKFLRSTSLDELPEFFNILCGDMSLIGPRPLLVQYLPLYNDHQKRRHEVRPGLSGLAQINGRNAISWEEKFDLDVEYVDNVTFWGDMKIIFQTVLKVLRREGINSANEATMAPFMGTKL
jgi:undecaprenyl phosphate N,N'-diacetylbacillosamine 1-phosphate transferase